MATRKKPTAEKEVKSKKPAKAEPKVKPRSKKVDAEDQDEAPKKKVKFDTSAYYSDVLDTISKRQGFESSGLDVAPPMSTGWLVTDIITGGGIRASMITAAGNEQCAKTTLALTTMASAIKESIPLIGFVDFEGCVTADTLLGYGKGKHAKINTLFDLSEVANWKPGTWVGQQRFDIDTLESGHTTRGTGVRTGSLYYRGKMPTTRVEFNTGNHLTGYKHKMFVVRGNKVYMTFMEDLNIGDHVLVAKNSLKQQDEEWRSVKGYGKAVEAKYEVSNYGVVRSKPSQVTRNVTSKLGKVYTTTSNLKSKILTTTLTNDGYASVSFCPGDGKVVQGLVHRVVALTFLEVPKIKSSRTLSVLHWNDNPLDNRVSNLRFGTDSEKVTLLTEHYAELDIKTLKDHYDLAAVTSVEPTGKKQHVYDVSLLGVAQDELPHAILTNGIVTHNSTKNSKPYVQSILNTCGLNMTVDQVFGKKNKDGTWAIRPRVRYRSETILESFYDWMSEILRELPDKKYVEGKWWLVFDEKNKKHKAMAGDFVDAAMTRKYGNGLWVEAPDDKIQAIIFVDSYTAMQPKIKDEEEIGNQLSVKASAFSKQLERIKGRMAEKMVTVYGLNHLRSNPMAMFGPKEDEKGGNALKQFSDVRLRQTSRSLSAAPFSPKADKNFDYNETEKSVEHKGGVDVYRYVHIKAIKNKLWTPQRTGFIRIWVRDGAGIARGIDPVFDTISYLKSTGQLTGSRKAFKLDLRDLGKGKLSVTWEELKAWVLGDKDTKVKISQKLGYKPFDLRRFCFKQMASGVGEELYVDTENNKTGSDDDGDEE